MSRDQAKAIIEKLVERFAEHRKDYHLAEYNEQKTRQDFINPFFKALGWDIDNEKGDSEAYREVIYEDKVVVRGKAKAPDYGFRLSGSGKKRLFYVEAKKPSVAIKTNKESAYQLRRYGSSAQAHVSILTNFEDFIIFDCSRVPNLNDSASVSRLKHIHFEDYVKEFDFIYDIFSHEAVTKGRFDKYVQSDTNKKGSQTLDKEFVESLDSWRKYLATSIALNNKKITDEELNYAVQLTIDRLIFLRFCEDRGVEPYGQLQKAVSKGDAYKNLLDLFKQADDKYNSGLFDFEKDQITPKLKIDNKVIKWIMEQLYYPICRYEFSVMPVEVLGNAYEQFLGKVIRTTPSGAVKIEEKPEVRKAGGVYYTPQYIVEYIVKNTLGKLIDGKAPKEIDKIKIVDPACGSGSFLVGAFEYLLDYHINWYHQKGYADKKGKDNPFTPQGTLTTHEKKRILTNNIFGVDLDANAVEVTKLSLLLKCMEGETEASIKQQTSMFHERVLPNLDDNIKDGNSLIDTDFYDNEINLGLERTIKPFSWKKSFPEVFRQGGFDVVIGNPPYVEFKQLDEKIKKALEPYYESARGKYDLFIPFIERAIKLTKPEGLTSFILPSMFTKRDYGQAIRKYITTNSKIEQLVYFGDFQVFDQVTIFPFIFVFSKSNPKTKDKTEIVLFPTQKGLNHSLVNLSLKNENSDKNSEKYKIETKKLTENPWNISNDSVTDLKNKLLNHPSSTPLKEITDYIFVGIQSGKDEVFFVDKEIIKENKLEKEIVIPIFKGRDILKYSTNWTGTFIIYPYDKKTNQVIPEKELKLKFPNVYSYLTKNRSLLKGRDYFDKSSKAWYELWCERVFQKFKQLKIVNAEISSDNRFYLDKDGFLGNTKTFNTVLKKDWANEYYYVLGLLNSKVLEFFHRQISVPKAGGFFEYKTQFINLYPIRKIDVKDKKEKQSHDEITKNSELLMSLYKELKEEKLPSKAGQLKQRIEHSTEKINHLVYDLYELTPEEIKIIEGGDNE